MPQPEDLVLEIVVGECERVDHLFVAQRRPRRLHPDAVLIVGRPSIEGLANPALGAGQVLWNSFQIPFHDGLLDAPSQIVGTLERPSEVSVYVVFDFGDETLLVWLSRYAILDEHQDRDVPADCLLVFLFGGGPTGWRYPSVPWTEQENQGVRTLGGCPRNSWRYP